MRQIAKQLGLFSASVQAKFQVKPNGVYVGNVIAEITTMNIIDLRRKVMREFCCDSAAYIQDRPDAAVKFEVGLG